MWLRKKPPQEIPAGTRLNLEEACFILVERPPMKRVVLTTDGPKYLIFPYTYYGVRYRKAWGRYKFLSLAVIFSPTRLKEMHERVYMLPLSNMSGNGWVCLGENPIKSQKSLNALVSKVINKFWSSEFAHVDDCLWKKCESIDDLLPDVLREVEAVSARNAFNLGHFVSSELHLGA